MYKPFIIAVLSFSVAACVTDATQINAPKSTQDKLGDAVLAPFNDFNIVQSAIPPILSEAVKNPYQLPADCSCKGLIGQVQLLDTALGPDLDAPIIATKKSDLEEGGDYVQNEAVGSVQRTMEGFIPFRSWIRKLTGAEKRSNDLRTAVAAGVVRRAFLKGMGLVNGCDPPASPTRLSPSDAAKPNAATASTAP